ncbi:MAG: tol-pal system protein YbgF [Acidobacteria bacterium]|nr:tol-pal system protein YbgF [Acidobacteriota bacterium]MBS1866379.1 tol-pal system protein YbgF [Acidobacteriota bacterium]
MRFRNIAVFGGAALGGLIVGSLLGPAPVNAVAREIIELQRDVTSLLQGQKDLSTQMTQDHTVMRTLVEQSSDSVGKLSASMGGLQKSVQDVAANGGARLDTMSTQVQGLSDNLEEIKSRLGKLNQQLTDLQNTVQNLDAKISGGSAPAGTVPMGGAAALPPTGVGATTPLSAAPSADTLYSNGYRDLQSGKYDLSHQEFLDYLKYYGDTDLASNAQFYLGEIAYAQKQYSDAIAQYEKVLTNYPKSFKLAPARLKKGMAQLELGQKTQGIRELREVVRRYPGTEEERRARAKLRDLGVAAAAP